MQTARSGRIEKIRLKGEHRLLQVYSSPFQRREYEHAKPGELLETLVCDKVRTRKSTVTALLEEIALRENLNSQLLEKIDDTLLHERNSLRILEERRDHYVPERFAITCQEKARVQDNILDLEKEKRQERLECWRDLMLLKKDLMIALKDYWDLVRRRRLLTESETS